MKRGITIAIAAAALAAAAILIAWTDDRPAHAPQVRSVEQAPTEPLAAVQATQVGRRVYAVERRNAEMAARLAEMDRKLAEQTESAEAERPERPVETTEQTVTRLSQGLANYLDNETASHDWATATEGEIADQMASGIYEGVTFEGAECRSTLCRVEMRFADRRSVSEFAARALSQHPWKYNAQMLPRSLDDYLAVDLYIAREGHVLPPL
ncbi:MAG: hypothetical protein AAGC55_24570 [Myxococcota bacterium]